jgi:hypothetical protein
MRTIGSVALAILIALSFAPLSSADPETGVLCVIPDPPSSQYYATVPFDLKTLMFKIDNGKKIAWPQKTGLKVENRALSTVRRIRWPGLETDEQIVPLSINMLTTRRDGESLQVLVRSEIAARLLVRKPDTRTTGPVFVRVPRLSGLRN